MSRRRRVSISVFIAGLDQVALSDTVGYRHAQQRLNDLFEVWQSDRERDLKWKR
jgi:hypothetical protein